MKLNDCFTKSEIELIKDAGVSIDNKAEYGKEDFNRLASNLTEFIMNHSYKNKQIEELQKKYSNIFMVIDRKTRK